jgi:hypothetical protein
VLKGFDLPAQDRLRDGKLAAGSGEAAQLGDIHEISELDDVHVREPVPGSSLTAYRSVINRTLDEAAV